MCWRSSAFAALVPVLQHQINDAGISQRDVAIERRRSARADGDGTFHTGRLQTDASDFIHHLFGPRQRRSIGRLHRDHEVALVLGRNETGRDFRQSPPRERDQRERKLKPSSRLRCTIARMTRR